MGTHINRANSSTSSTSSSPIIPSIPWLDSETAAGVTDITQSLALMHPEVVAVILFGSVARHEERPLDDPEPSDVDLLILIDPALLGSAAQCLTHEQELAITQTIGEADYRHRLAPREIKATFLYRDLVGWDPLFIENVARDGILLWSRGSLPAQLARVAERDVTTFLSLHG